MQIKDKDKEKVLNEVMVGVRERIGKHRDSLAELADEAIQLQVDELIAKTKLLAQIAGGAEKGAVWHANFDPKKADILEHYRMTLDKVTKSRGSRSTMPGRRRRRPMTRC